MNHGPSDDTLWSPAPGRAGLVIWIAFTLAMLAVPVIVTVGQAGNPIGDRTTVTGWGLAVVFSGGFLYFLARTAGYMRLGLYRLQASPSTPRACGGDAEATTL